MFPPERMWLVTGQEISDAVKGRRGAIPETNVLTEPSSNNTCLAIAWAIVEIAQRDPDATLIVLSADHAIEPQDTFLTVIREGVRLARSEPSLVTIGITPTRPETGYGYIELGTHFATSNGIASYQVDAFREKPDRDTAQEYYFDRRHLWNAGIFVWTAQALLEALEKHRPAMFAALQTYSKTIGSPQQSKALADLYATADCISIDNAILESADNVLVIKADMIWDDVGSWLALQRLKHSTSDNNLLVGASVVLDSYDMTIYNESDDLVCAYGVSDLVVVRTNGVTMVAHKSRVDDIKSLIEYLRLDGRWEKHL
jgi:mannose-1-phosphate guanylyltransferase